MGYLIYYSFDHIRIPASQLAAALGAIYALYQPETIERLGTGLIYDPITQAVRACYRGGKLPSPSGFASLRDALQAWSLKVVEHADGSLEVVAYGADKAGDEAVLFEAIAPFLDYSYSPKIEAVQENHEYWRHTFTNQQHRRALGKVVYADEYPELFDASEAQ